MTENKEEHAINPYCTGCDKSPEDIQEYIDAADENGMTPEDYVRSEEGTYNRINGHFLCTSCYTDAGMPSSLEGWVAP